MCIRKKNREVISFTFSSGILHSAGSTGTIEIENEGLAVGSNKTE